MDESEWANDLIKAVKGMEKAYLDFLYSIVAIKLVGRPVLLEWEPPLLDGARGLTMKNGDRGVVIQINPELKPDQKFKTFLHECAHGLLHYDGLAQKSDFDHIPEVSAARGKQIIPDWLMDRRKEEGKKREQEAKDQAELWFQIAGDGDIRERLRRL